MIIANDGVYRGLIEHEKKVYAINIKQKQEMEKCKIILARKIEKMKVEATDAAKRARAAAAVEATLFPGTFLILPFLPFCNFI